MFLERYNLAFLFIRISIYNSYLYEFSTQLHFITKSYEWSQSKIVESQLTILLGEKLVLQDLHQTSEHRLVGCWSLYPCCWDHRARFSTNTASALRKCRPVAAAPAGEIISGQQNPWRNQHQLPKQGATLSFFFF